MEPEKVTTHAEQVAAEGYGLLSFDDRQGLIYGEISLTAFEQAHDRFRTDRYPDRPSPQWDRDFMRALREMAVWKRGLK